MILELTTNLSSKCFALFWAIDQPLNQEGRSICGKVLIVSQKPLAQMLRPYTRKLW